MITFENIPQCISCGAVLRWHDKVSYSDGCKGSFGITCFCGKIMSVERTTKELFHVHEVGNYWAIDNEIEKEMTVWTLLGKRDDGTFYNTGLFPTKDAALKFRSDNHFHLIAVAEFKGTFKLFESDLKRK
jgi:hypothetical protein